jgi:hypothetical protein
VIGRRGHRGFEFGHEDDGADLFESVPADVIVSDEAVEESVEAAFAPAAEFVAPVYRQLALDEDTVDQAPRSLQGVRLRLVTTIVSAAGLLAVARRRQLVVGVVALALLGGVLRAVLSEQAPEGTGVGDVDRRAPRPVVPPVRPRPPARPFERSRPRRSRPRRRRRPPVPASVPRVAVPAPSSSVSPTAAADVGQEFGFER